MRSASRTAARASASPTSTCLLSHSTIRSPPAESTRILAIGLTSSPPGRARTPSRAGLSPSCRRVALPELVQVRRLVVPAQALERLLRLRDEHAVVEGVVDGTQRDIEVRAED